MRRKDKTVAMLKANMLFEQRCNKKLNEALDNLDEVINPVNEVTNSTETNKYIIGNSRLDEGRIKDDWESITNSIKNKLTKLSDKAPEVRVKAKEAVAKIGDFAVKELNKEENKEKAKEAIKKIKDVTVKLEKAGKEIYKDKEKLKKLIDGLNLSAIITGVGWLGHTLFNLVDSYFTCILTLSCGSSIMFKITLFLALCKLIVSLISGFKDFSDIITGIGNTIKSFANFFTSKFSSSDDKNVNESLQNLTLNESIELLLNSYKTINTI